MNYTFFFALNYSEKIFHLATGITTVTILRDFKFELRLPMNKNSSGPGRNGLPFKAMH